MWKWFSASQTAACSLQFLHLAWYLVLHRIIFFDEMMGVFPFLFRWHPKYKPLVRAAIWTLLHLYPALLVPNQPSNTECCQGTVCLWFPTFPPALRYFSAVHGASALKLFCNYQSQSHSVESSLIYEGVFKWRCWILCSDSGGAN